MKVTLTFEKKDFATLREFEKAVEKAVEKQCGKTYVSGSYLCWYFDFPAELQTLLSPVQRGSDAYKAMAAKLETGTVSFEIESTKVESKN
jgi:hypothetical protein